MTADSGVDTAPSADPYAQWDAAYVLGSLSSSDRRSYEDHLASCPDCREATAQLSGIPALLAMVDRSDMMHTADERPAEAPALPPGVYPALVRKVTARRRRKRWVTAAVAAAAAVLLGLAVLVAVRPGMLAADTEPPVAAPALTMTPREPSEFEASVILTPQRWGTQIDMACTYHSWVTDDHDQHGTDEADGGDKLAMVAVGRDGSRTALATWLALPSATARPSASTALSIDEIASVQIVSADNGEVLLQRDL